MLASFLSTLPTLAHSKQPPAGDNPPWSVSASREVYENPWTKVVEEELIGPDEQEGLYGYFAPIDCVVVVPLWLEDGTLHTALVEQWRQPIREYSWEVPCGRIEPGESVEDSARRELAEECGFNAGQLIPIGTWRHSDARVAGIIHTFAAVDLSLNQHASKDASEVDLSAFRLTWREALQAMDAGAVNQVASMSALLHCDRHKLVQEQLTTP